MSKHQATQNDPTQYSMGAFFPAPPYQYRGSKIFSIVFKTTPDVLRELVPQALVPNPDNLLAVYFGSLNASKPPDMPLLNYLEVGILVPVIFPKTKAPGNYVPALYLDTPVGIAGGREVFGFPKKDAKLTFSVKDGEISGVVERLGTVLLKLNGKLDKKLESLPNEPDLPFFVEKIIPSGRRNAPPDVWQLVSARQTDSKINEFWTCTGNVEFASGPEDPLGRIKILGIVRARFVDVDFLLDYGEVLHDFLSRE